MDSKLKVFSEELCHYMAMISTPVCIFNSEEQELLWCNLPALKLWGANSFAELKKRDFKSGSEGAIIWFKNNYKQLVAGKKFSLKWTMYPNEKPVTVDMSISGIVIDNEKIGTFIEYFPEEKEELDDEILRMYMSLRFIPITISIFNIKEKLLSQNLMANTIYGSKDPVKVFSQMVLEKRFVDNNDYLRLVKKLGDNESFADEVKMKTLNGVRWHLINCRKTKDPITGEDIILIVENDIEDRKMIEESLHKTNNELAKKNEMLESLSSKLSKYLSPQIYESIFLGKKDVKLESYRKTLTIFFSDIKDFTEITERTEPETLNNLLNNYLNEMSKIALKYGGTIDKFIGDAILIFFGDPETKGKKEDALACVQMAIDMREKMKELQLNWYKQGITKPMRIRMGINTGYCTVGNIGSENRLEYTIIGRPVNIASRLESMAEPDEILISHSTYSMVNEEVECHKKSEINVKGITYPIDVYKVLHSKDQLGKNKNNIVEQKNGFSLSLNLAEINRSETDEIINSLEKTLAILKSREK